MESTDQGSDPGDGTSRTYAIAFHDVWEAALASARGLGGWQVLGQDPRAGEIRLRSLNRLGRAPMEGQVRVSLDDLGQTRLEVGFEEPRHPLRRGAGGARTRRFLKHLDRSLGLSRRR